MDSTRRSLAKAISWRLIAICITATLAYLITGQAGFAAKLGLADTLLKIFIYVAHERVWNRIAFGKQKEPEYTI